MAMTKEQLDKIKAGAEASKAAGAILQKADAKKENWVSKLKKKVKAVIAKSDPDGARSAPRAKTTTRDEGVKRGVGSALTKDELDKMRSPGAKK